MMKNFLRCGLAGWCMEILFTSFQSFRKRDLRLIGQTSLWMFPIYGMAALFSPLSHHIQKQNIATRGLIYAACIYTAEFVSGILLKRRDACPWDYSNVRANIKGVIRLDYTPAWFLAGLFFEQFLKKL